MAPVPVDLSKLSDVVNKKVLKKDVYDELLKKVNSIQTNDTIDSVKKTDYNTKINEVEKKITDHRYDKYTTTQQFN